MEMNPGAEELISLPTPLDHEVLARQQANAWSLVAVLIAAIKLAKD